MAHDTDRRPRNWYRLDNVGKFYSSQAGRSAQTVFRYAATMSEPVNPTALQTAWEHTIAVFPSFNVHLRNGFFWHYLEQSERTPAVEPERHPICARLHTGPDSPLLRVSYYQARINLEVSHMIADGRGALVLFKALLHEYAHVRYGIEAAAAGLDGSAAQKAEDGFAKFYDPSDATAARHHRDADAGTDTAAEADGKSTEGSANDSPASANNANAQQSTTDGGVSNAHKPRLYRIAGLRDRTRPTFMECHLDVRAALGIAHRMDVTLTALLVAAIIGAIRDSMPRRQRNRAIRVDIPVDLRAFFDSRTVRNFFGLTFVAYTPGDTDESLETIARRINTQLAAAVVRERAVTHTNRMIRLERNPLLRLSPSPAKDLVLELASRIVAASTTTTMSNIGRVRLDDAMAPYVRDLNVTTTPEGLNFMACSYGNDLSIGISTSLADLDAVRGLCRTLTGLGLQVRMHIAGAEAQHAGIMDGAADTTDDTNGITTTSNATAKPSSNASCAMNTTDATDNATRGTANGLPEKERA
ncbi:phthiocerol/phthiodiolone dimycocerosyl transferase family protein [Bifidobacterium oedipodis]|uniref:Alcohol acetyltransferase n=1 Tax=Bifidobacterium oedipodis TaxID=2675322 RepID=A0A7Y0ENY3_9BIFI|nr:alcohol acetyltransferase [Bifidobacterium sp. DSM 109957]NMM93744.1 alcohol acetyltransferase [Bifidobacterium sp. DSM 109957]